MNINLYCCQRCGNLKYDWSGNLCPECLYKDRLRKEGKKYFGMPIKMREATKEEKQGVDEYIQSVSEKVYSKDEIIAMLTELQQEIKECVDGSEGSPQFEQGVAIARNQILEMIQEKINDMRERK